MELAWSFFTFISVEILLILLAVKILFNYGMNNVEYKDKITILNIILGIFIVTDIIVGLFLFTR